MFGEIAPKLRGNSPAWYQSTNYNNATYSTTDQYQILTSPQGVISFNTGVYDTNNVTALYQGGGMSIVGNNYTGTASCGAGGTELWITGGNFRLISMGLNHSSESPFFIFTKSSSITTVGLNQELTINAALAVGGNGTGQVTLAAGTSSSTGQLGIYINASNSTTHIITLGDYNGVGNNTRLAVDDYNTRITYGNTNVSTFTHLDANGNCNIPTGTSYEINAVSILSATTLGSSVVTSSLTHVGTLVAGATGAGFTVALGTSTVTGTLGVGNGGTGTGTTFTAGSVIFAGTSGIYSQNNNDLFWDNTNFRLGINTTASPSSALHVIGAKNTSDTPASWTQNLIFDNASASTQNITEFRLAGTKRGSIRVDSVGDIVINGSSTGGVYLNWDEGTGGIFFGSASADAASFSVNDVGAINNYASNGISSATGSIANTETLVVKSQAMLTSRLQLGSVIEINLAGTYTGAATPGAPIFRIRMGTNGTTSDTAIMSFTLANNATSGSSIQFSATILLTVTNAGGSASGGFNGQLTLVNQGTTGISTTATQVIGGTTVASFTGTTASQYIDVTFISSSTGSSAVFNQASINFVYL